VPGEAPLKGILNPFAKSFKEELQKTKEALMAHQNQNAILTQEIEKLVYK